MPRIYMTEQPQGFGWGDLLSSAADAAQSYYANRPTSTTTDQGPNPFQTSLSPGDFTLKPRPAPVPMFGNAGGFALQNPMTAMVGNHFPNFGLNMSSFQ